MAETPVGLGEAAKIKRQRRSLLVAVTILADVSVIVLSIFVWSYGYLSAVMEAEHSLLLSAIVLPVYLAIAFNTGAFQIEAESRRILPLWRAIAAMFYSSSGLLLFVFLTRTNEEFSRVVVTCAVISALIGLVLERLLMNRWSTYLLGTQPFATLCIYDRVPMEQKAGFSRISAQSFGLTADLSDPNMISKLADIANDFDRLVIHCRPDDRESWAFMLKSLRIPAEISVPEIHALHPVSIHLRAGRTTMLINTGPLQWHQRALKRAFDLVIAITALLLAMPAFLIIALLIKLDSSGPVLFRQPRIGLNNRQFEIYKFRTMRSGQLDLDGKQSTARDDPRVTRVGALLRRTSIDELPQLINVLKGEMSIVGPRPHARLSRAGGSLFWEVDSSYWHRHTVKPGITGLAQVRGHRGNTFHEDHLRLRLRSDLEYVANWSLTNDFYIIFKTLGVLSHKNAF